MKDNDLLESRISRVYIRYLLPTIIAMVTQSIYCLADVFFISIGVGSQGLAAMNIAMPIFTVFSAFGILLGVGGATTMSISEGGQDHDTRNKAFSLSMISAFVCGLVVMILGTLFLEPLCYVLGSDASLLPQVKEYMMPLVILAVPAVMAYAMQVLIRSDRNPALVMGAMVTSNILNIILDYVFVVMFKWGMFGASFATAISPVVSCLILCAHFFQSIRSVRFSKHCFDRHLLFRIIKNGSGSALLEVSAGVVVIFFNLVILKIGGAIYLAAYAIVTNIAYVIKGLLNGFAQAVQPIISVNHGAKLFHRVHHSFRVAIYFTCGFACITYIGFLLAPEFVCELFADGDMNLTGIAANALVLYFSSLLFTAANTIILYYLQSTEETRLSTFLTICRGFLFIIIGLLVLPEFFGINGVWLTVSFAEIITFIISIPYLYRKMHTLKEGTL